jgi:acetyl esterase/lipase
VAIAAVLVLGGCLVAEPGPADRPPAGAGSGVEAGPPFVREVTTTHTYDPDRHLELDLHRQAGLTGRNPPVIVSLHGGGWTSGTRAAPEPALLAQIGRGFVVAAVDYRLAFTDPFPAAVLDVKGAIQWISAQPGYEASPVVVAGPSAGGNLAVLVAVSSGVDALEPVPGRRTVVRAAVSIDGPQDLRAMDEAPWRDWTWPMDALGPGPARERYGERIETGELVPAYLGCRPPSAGLRGPNAEPGLRAPNAEPGLRGPNAEPGLRGPNAEPGLRGPNAEPGCDRLVGERIGPASTTTWIDAADPPVYLACLAANAVLPDCAHDAGRFAVAYVAAHGGDRMTAWVDQIRSPDANHFTAGAFVNLTALNRFLDANVRV